MIRRGRAEGWLRLPISAFKPWADLNGVTLNGIRVGLLPGYEDRGSTIIAERALSDGEDPLMVVPRDLVLSLEGVQNHARSDRNLQELLSALGDYGRVSCSANLDEQCCFRLRGALIDEHLSLPLKDVKFTSLTTARQPEDPYSSFSSCKPQQHVPVFQRAWLFGVP